jgi:GNAT superfamily N-acetyltransferase
LSDELSEEPYDGPVATALVQALMRDLNERYAEWAEDWPDEEREERQASSDADYLAEVTPAQVSPPHGAFVVAWLDGQPVACGALRPAEADGEAEVKRMYTAPAVRRRGIGNLVLERLEARAAELGYRRLRLETGTAQPEAIALYERAGWHHIASYGRYAGHAASVCLGKDLGA